MGLHRNLDTAPHVPIEGTSAVPMFNEEIQIDLLRLGDLITLHHMNASSKNSLFTRGRSKHAQEVWGAFRGARIEVSDYPKCIQMDEEGK